MKKKLKNYIKEIEEKLKRLNKEDIEKLKKEHLIKINIFQHERLISLLITLFIGLFTVISFLLSTANQIFFITTTILVILLLASLYNYFYIENGLKKLYDEYDKMV